MLKKTALFLFLGIFSLIGLLKNASCSDEPSLSASNYMRMDKTPEQELLAGKDLTVFKNFPATELEWLDNAAEETGLTKLATSELTEKDILQDVVGKTFYGLSCTQKPYSLYFGRDQSADCQMADGRHEKGTYWLDASGLHAKFPTIHKGTPTTAKYYYTKYANCYVLVSDRRKGYSIMVAKKGDTENL